jgi:hypothetical protein
VSVVDVAMRFGKPGVCVATSAVIEKYGRRGRPGSGQEPVVLARLNMLGPG